MGVSIDSVVSSLLRICLKTTKVKANQNTQFRIPNHWLLQSRPSPKPLRKRILKSRPSSKSLRKWILQSWPSPKPLQKRIQSATVIVIFHTSNNGSNQNGPFNPLKQLAFGFKILRSLNQNLKSQHNPRKGMMSTKLNGERAVGQQLANCRPKPTEIQD